MRRTATAILTFLMLTASAEGGGRAERHAPAESARKTCSQPVYLDMSGPRPAATLTAANGEQVPAIFDTGAMNTVVNPAFAGRLGMVNQGPLQAPYNKHSSGYQSSLVGARIGSLPLPSRSVPVMPIPLADKAVILSPAAFPGQLVRLDLAKGTLQVCGKQSPPAGVTVFPYTRGAFALPAIALEIGQHSLEAHFDTGSPYDIIMPTHFASQLDLAEPLEQVGKIRMHSGERPFHAARLNGQAKVGPLIIDNPRIGFSELIPGPNIGMGILKRLVITVDPDAKRNWVELASD